ncbi:LysR family transcriptional regulator [Zhengella mangrovi]|uniref:HTH-type transcriptional regulator CbbR n=1 Tax=Zhengella mangrovi TaxID=1982044 RepID=A0A2G1QLG3_9HYPH|nr:LysR family transcriptional regulator [Zhengella mangrovi]PHP66301.1 LysR family transcriptional regulator [Zhengella mangrovi]
MINASIRQLRTLLAIRQHGKISSAANALGLTSPAVTIQLRQLEEELGTQLFIRTRTGAIATETGLIALETAQKMLDELNALEERLKQRQGLMAGRVRLGAVSTGKYFAPRVIAAFSAAHPGIEIALTTANRSDIIAMLERHEIDMALMGRPPRHFGVRATLFGDHPLVFIAHPGHPLAGRRDILRSELTRQKFIVREPGSGTRASFEFFMADTGDDTAMTMTEMDSNETIKQAVMAGLGIAFISGHTIEQEIRAGTLAILDVEDTPIRRQWFSVRHSDRSPTPAMLALDDFLRRKGPEILPLLKKTYPAASLA